MRIKTPSKELYNVNIKIRTQSLKSLIEIIKDGLSVSQEKEEMKLKNYIVENNDLYDLHTLQEVYELEYVNNFEGPLKCSQLENTATYSLIPACYMIFETNLVAFAKIAHDYYSLNLKYSELSGGKTDKIKTYLKKLANIDVTQISSWNDLMELEIFRNCIVHNDGKINTDFKEKDRKKIENLANTNKYDSLFSISKPLHEDENFMVIKFSLCEYFIEKIEFFFDELIELFGLNQNFYFRKEAAEHCLEERGKAKAELENDIKKAKDKYNKRMESL